MKDGSVLGDGLDELDALFRAERVGLTRLAYLLSGSREAAEDAVQIAFAQAVARWDSIDNPGGYVRQVVVNQIKDGQRRTARRARRSGWNGEPEPVTRIPEIDETWGLIGRLPWNQQAVVVLHFYQDLPLTEIAGILDRPDSTVRSDLRRALARLRKVLP